RRGGASPRYPPPSAAPLRPYARERTPRARRRPSAPPPASSGVPPGCRVGGARGNVRTRDVRDRAGGSTSARTPSSRRRLLGAGACPGGSPRRHGSRRGAEARARGIGGRDRTSSSPPYAIVWRIRTVAYGAGVVDREPAPAYDEAPDGRKEASPRAAKSPRRETLARDDGPRRVGVGRAERDGAPGDAGGLGGSLGARARRDEGQLLLAFREPRRAAGRRPRNVGTRRHHPDHRRARGVARPAPPPRAAARRHLRTHRLPGGGRCLLRRIGASAPRADRASRERSPLSLSPRAIRGAGVLRRRGGDLGDVRLLHVSRGRDARADHHVDAGARARAALRRARHSVARPALPVWPPPRALTRRGPSGAHPQSRFAGRSSARFFCRWRFHFHSETTPCVTAVRARAP